VDRFRPRRAAKRALDNGKPSGLEPRRTRFCRTWFRCAKLPRAKFAGAKPGCSKSPVSESGCAKYDFTKRDFT
jgi:hypothetical protein